MYAITTIIHLYYPGSWQLIRDKCAVALNKSKQVIITVCHEDVITEIGNQPGYIVLKVPNMGKDVGGKLAALSFYMNYCSKTDYLIFLHDKISPQTINATYWQDQLYSIFTPDRFEKMVSLFAKNKKAGLAGSKSFLKNEYNPSKETFNTTNNQLLKELIKKYGLQCKDFHFIAGTIFMVRSEIYEHFFTLNSALEARVGLEKGNVIDLHEGTVTHCWERLFSFIANHYQYEVRGIA